MEEVAERSEFQASLTDVASAESASIGGGPRLSAVPRTGRSRVELVRDEPLYAMSKRLFDIVMALAASILAAPILLLAAIAIRLTSRGPVIFRQPRCGQGGEPFTCFKLRTMLDGAQEQKAAILHRNEVDGPIFKIRDDPRITPVGRILRRLSLDELPQLWNILRGDMSIVGPRPPLPEEVALYTPFEWQRLAVRPGLTCRWQVLGRSEIGFARWVELDLEYIRKRSYWYDLTIVLRTIPAVLSGRGAA